MTIHLTLYGTLRKGQPMLAHFAGEALDRGAMRWLGECLIPGLLIDCGEYPALVEPGRVASGIRADLFALDDPETLTALDAYEDIDPDCVDDSEYRRVLLPLLNGPVAGISEAMAYIWNRPADGMPVIESGDWLIHIGESPRDPPRERPGGV